MSSLEDCYNFELLWSILMPRENLNRLESLTFSNLPLYMGVPVISVLANSNIHSLIDLDLSDNADWWQDKTLF